MERSFRSAQTASISLNSVELSEFTSFNFLKILVLTSVRTASTYLSSLMLVKNKVRSFRSAQTASTYLNSLMLVKNKDRSFRFAQTASMYLSSLMLVKNKDRSSHYRSNCVNVPKFVCVPIGLDSLRYIEKPPVLVALIGRLL